VLKRPTPFGADAARCCHRAQEPQTDTVTAPQPSPVVTIPGSHGRALGCSADWLPDCDRLALSLQPDGSYAGTFDVPVGFYEYKIAIAGSWTENYGASGTPSGPNIAYNWAGGRLVFHYDPTTHVSWCTAGGGLEAIWADRGTVLLAPQSLQLGRDERIRLSWTLQSAQNAGLDANIDSATSVVTTLRLGQPSPAVRTRFPQYRGHLALHLDDSSTAADALRGQLLLVGRDDQGLVRYATGVQIAGVLEDLYAAAVTRTLGASWTAGVPSIAVWAPTAQRVALLLWRSDDDLTATPAELPMSAESDGSWTITGDPSWAGRPYLFRVVVFAPSTRRVEVNDVTDPYSIGLTFDSTHSLLLDLADPGLAPQVWTDEPGPRTERAVDLTIYEMHVRDFSIGDSTVPAVLRGTYSAFGVPGSAGTIHLAGLASAGVNTLELLPTFDFTTVPEAPPQREPLDLGHLPADSDEQQRTVAELAEADGYNWGYDPFHWQVPEGSYAVGDGPDRIREFRTMVGALHQLGFNVVLDQVFNHTGASGQEPKSVLDQVVPGYYQRLDEIGRIYNSTCCSNVATENLMAGKLLVDSVVVWARHYRVDGFRFDLMGFHSRDTMLAVRAALDTLTIAVDGIDGRRVHLFGEGWNFGEVAYDRLFVQARQGNLGGTGIGTFNDRLRDAVHGGGSGDAEMRRQGFGSGLFTDPNPAADQGDAGGQLWRLRNYTDLVQLGLAGNLRDYAFRMGDGRLLRGDQIDYNGQQAGYCDQPDEAVNYVDAHDNHTLFDTLLLRLPDATPLADVVRMHTLSLATVVLSQSLCFVLGGSDLLRSKSFDANSYNSGDWFNQIDWSGTTNGFGRGLPPARANTSRWATLGPLLVDPANRPTQSDIAASSAQVRDLFRLRASTILFRLGSADLIRTKVSFPISGPSAEPGTIVMLIDDTLGPDVDPALHAVLVVFNATPRDVTQTVPLLAGRRFELHPVQAGGADLVVRRTIWDAGSETLTVPARSVAVLVER
jgi:pullulanase-type alpha-1,6-glucosidase